MHEESYFHTVLRRFGYHKAGVLSLIVFCLITLIALIGPLFLPYSPEAIVGSISASPDQAHLLGTDQIGRDILTRLLYGTRVSLFVGLLVTFFSTLIGVVLGLLSGYYGGFLDACIMRFTDMMMSFPYILLVLVAGAIFRPGLWSIIVILSLVSWPGAARLVRGSVLSLKEQDFVKSSQIAGMSRAYILFSDLFPNTVAQILIFATTVMASSILDEAALSFLGMGIQAPMASLGNMLNGAQSLTVLTRMPWLWVPPGFVIILLVICVNFIGDALRDAMDPTTIR